MFAVGDEEYIAEVDLTLADLQNLLDLLDAAERMSLVVSGIHNDGKLGDLREMLRKTYHTLLEKNFGDVLIRERSGKTRRSSRRDAD
jgi:hypothetical protein